MSDAGGSAHLLAGISTDSNDSAKEDRYSGDEVDRESDGGLQAGVDGQDHVVTELLRKLVRNCDRSNLPTLAQRAVRECSADEEAIDQVVQAITDNRLLQEGG